jgi:mRNA interferase YafQ
MRTIEWTGQFKRDYKRESKGQYSGALKSDLFPLIDKLANDLTLEPRHRDHPLTGEWRDHRDCHIRPDLVLIYQKSGAGILRLVRLGSHSELGL